MTKEIEKKYVKSFKDFDLRQCFYFSYNYNLSHTLQENILKKVKQNEPEDRFEDAFNSFSKGGEHIGASHIGASFIRGDIKRKEVFEGYYPHNEMFLWNFNLMNDFFFLLKNKSWAIPIIHGYIKGISKLF